MYESAAEDANSTQAAETTDLDRGSPATGVPTDPGFGLVGWRTRDVRVAGVVDAQIASKQAYLAEQERLLRAALCCRRVDGMNVMNMWKRAMFMPQPHENKGRLNVMNVVRKFFQSRRTSLAKPSSNTAMLGHPASWVAVY